MWPYVIQQPFQVGTYGVMMAVGFLTAFWLLVRELRRRNIDVKVAEITIFLGILGGVVGAKLAYMLTEADEFVWRDLFSGSGLTWHGGLILAAVFIIVYFAAKRLPMLVMLDAVAPMLASGYAFGRIGCQLAGDGDVGIPCVPGSFADNFCMTYPRGIVPSSCEVGGRFYEVCPANAMDPTWLPVHPTPIYESLTNFALFGLLWAIRRKFRRPGFLFAIYLVIAGFLRFGIEFIRVSEGRPDRFLGLRDAQLIALGEVLLGLIIAAWTYFRTVPKNQEYGILKPAESVESV
ncbi:MAG TPA: prolipoprotein diacylglyceryl transferase [Myxococcota bacterium]|nr:prolipoprotein diacylglyceryl transferase [Myxococcota bacterium]HOE82709.1 prolipoprotein diacylglyceryl transferase [Myxococcota bacterium]HON25817.1 prolipoprotein diacylglyceryl transferase [Myxococcota bacterium]HOS62885.1 prolipoprotein diacylglyceryl transferase [Myxococcota bacterium]HPC92707.1 prolipoprotein diacylglyceryl transferase [Myxococcota bacterium]